MIVLGFYLQLATYNLAIDGGLHLGEPCFEQSYYRYQMMLHADILCILNEF